MSEVKSENTNGIATTTTTNTNDPPPAPATTTVPAAPVIVTPPMIVKGTIKFDPMTNICSLTAKWAMNQEQMDSEHRNQRMNVLIKENHFRKFK